MNAVVTVAIGDAYSRLAELTHPTIRRYADRIGAEFVVLNGKRLAQTTPHWEKFQIFDILNRYERVAYLDSDLIVRGDCPSLFDVVPKRKLGLFNEGPFTDRSRELMIDVCKKYDTTLPDWDGKYYNSGVMVASRCHRELFRKPEREVFSFYEQSYLNMVLAREKPEIHELPHQFNRMTCMDRFTGEDRFASYIIHYAGYPQLEKVLNLIPLDLKRWEADAPRYEYRRHIYVSVSGGAGDQICAEPSIRFMRRMYPDDEFVVACHWPRMFRHLERDGVVVCRHGEARLRDDTPYYLARSLPGPDTVQWMVVSHLLCHSVDYCSMALMKRTLPVGEKRLRFEVDDGDVENLAGLIRADSGSLEKSVVVHPGRHWNSKTFPTSWWQAVLDGLASGGRTVFVVGKDEPGDPPDFKAGARGTVDVECPAGVVDLRNLLDIGGLAALLSRAGVLVSNDSFPVHLAGAFDNWIVLIPSCKHPDHVLPWREGRTGHKALAMYRRLVLDDIESRPTQVRPTSAEVESIDWGRYLPDPGAVVGKVEEILGG